MLKFADLWNPWAVPCKTHELKRPTSLRPTTAVVAGDFDADRPRGVDVEDCVGSLTCVRLESESGSHGRVIGVVVQVAVDCDVAMLRPGSSLAWVCLKNL